MQMESMRSVMFVLIGNKAPSDDLCQLLLSFLSLISLYQGFINYL